MMMLFFLTVLACIYSYALYPMILIVLDRKQALGFSERGDESLTITIIITAFNEEERIHDKLTDTLALDYPREQLEIIVASDASNDRTDEIVKEFDSLGVKLVRADEHNGKEYAQSLAINASKGEILVFSDAATKINPDSLRVLARKFSNTCVGAVSSEDKFLSQDGKIAGEGLYVKYEMWLRRIESRVNSLIGLSGSYFAARKEVCKSWDIASPSDFNTAINCARLGLIAISDPEVVGYYKDMKDTSKEYRRKYRTIVRGITAVFRSAEVLNPIKFGFFSFQIWSHKIMRWAVPWFMLVLFIICILEFNSHWIYSFTLFAQLAFYTLALLGFLFKLTRRNAVVKLAYFFMQVNLATAHAATAYLFGKRITVWTPSKR